MLLLLLTAAPLADESLAVQAVAALGALLFFGGLFGLYFLPAWIADRRCSRHAGGIFLLNLLLGWTVLGWVGALIWSTLPPRDPDRPGAPPVSR